LVGLILKLPIYN